MKVLFISAAFPPLRTGEADHSLHLCQRLADRGETVHVLTTKGCNDTSHLPFTVHPLMSDWSWTELPRFVRFIKQCSPDAVLLFYIGWVYNYHPMITFVPTICRRLLPGCRFVTMIPFPMGSQNERFSFTTRAIRKAMKWWFIPGGVDWAYGTVLRDSEALIFMSDRHRRILSERNPAVEKKGVIIPAPPLLTMTSAKDEVTREQTRARLGLTSSHFVLVYFGYIYPYKGIETLLKAFHLVSQDRSWVRLVLVGGVHADAYATRPRFAEEMRELPKQLGLDEKVIWTGEFAADSDEASRYLYASDTCVFSHDTGLYLNNSSFAAAAAHGLPIVATQGSFVEEPFVDGQNLVFCQPKSPESMAAAIRRVVDDQELRRCIAKGALKLAAEWYSWEKATDRTIETFCTNSSTNHPSTGLRKLGYQPQAPASALSGRRVYGAADAPSEASQSPPSGATVSQPGE